MTSCETKKFNKFCLGAVFLLIGSSIFLTDIVDWIGIFESFYVLEDAAILNIFISLLSLGGVVTLSIFLFMKKGGIALSISSFAVAFTALLQLIGSGVYWSAIDDWLRIQNGGTIINMNDVEALFDSMSYSISAEIIAYRILYVFALLTFIVTFTAIGISALIPKAKTFVKAMKITSLVTAIVYVVFHSLCYILDIAGGHFTGALMLLTMSNYAMFYVGILLTRGWCFKLIEADAESYEPEGDYLPDEAPAYADAEEYAPAFEASPIVEKVSAPQQIASAAPAPASSAPANISTPAASAAPAPKASSQSKISVEELALQLRTFKLLLDDGIITEEEFNAKKKELLG